MTLNIDIQLVSLCAYQAGHDNVCASADRALVDSVVLWCALCLYFGSTLKFHGAGLTQLFEAEEDVAADGAMGKAHDGGHQKERHHLRVGGQDLTGFFDFQSVFLCANQAGHDDVCASADRAHPAL